MPLDTLTIWITGMPCSGKTTLAVKLLHHFRRFGIRTSHLDGDAVRETINSDLNFTPDGRKENLRRVAHLCKYLTVEAQCDIVICSFVSPCAADRLMVRNMVGNTFIEVLLNCSTVECEKRDVKGMYLEQKQGLRTFIKPGDYEYTTVPEITIDTTFESISHSFETLTKALVPFIQKVPDRN